MDVYRIGNSKYAEVLNGEGARLHGGRWNPVGIPCLYTSERASLCVLEYACNVPLELLPLSLSVTVITLPDDSWQDFRLNELPKNWSEVPVPVETQLWGSEKLAALDVLALKLPSVVIPFEYNYIINPLHPDFRKVKIKEVRPFNFDKRLKQ
jgi:RES domain-containing protein